ncbi:MAG TPA: hypothetical protein GX743_11695 [Actinomycetales bacterium]|nr:hypothetical protein [Actinomycetales bacterium]
MSTGPLHDLAESTESMAVLDGPADFLTATASKLTADEETRRLLTGEALGTHLHPASVHLPIGTAISALIVDLLAGEEGNTSAGILSAASLATAVPSILSGFADYGRIRELPVRRLGAAHALANVAGNTLNLTSLLARMSGSRGTARGGLLAAVAAFGVGGLLGGHLAHSEGAPEETAEL